MRLGERAEQKVSGYELRLASFG
ncbi:hypothetical protein STHE1630_00371 [Streptococcus thermophilus CNCM I-1630]|nr:hypothetical protein STHE1630_00371 [Streptococcus thermophilus CNCM I-1630]